MTNSVVGRFTFSCIEKFQMYAHPCHDLESMSPPVTFSSPPVSIGAMLSVRIVVQLRRSASHVASVRSHVMAAAVRTKEPSSRYRFAAHV
jgi:hypothetical protein